MSDEMAQRILQLESQVNLLTRMMGAPQAQETLPDLSAALAKAITALEPLKPLLLDVTVNDILINDANNVFVERAGHMQRVDLRFPDDAAIFEIASAIAAHAGRQISHDRPMVDARLPDGSRVNIIAPPLALGGTAISIRKFASQPITLDIMAQQGNTSPALTEFLKIIARCRLNIVISGGTGSGKTTLLNALSQYIDNEERVVTIEDAAELRLQQPNIVRLETKPDIMERSHSVTIRDLVRNALRMRPDRIIVGEVRGAEAFDMLQAMNTGHEGSLTTIHANHPRDALARLENMITMVNLNLPNHSIKAQIASAIHLIVQTSRMRDGKRRVTFISEVVGMESEMITMQDLFVFKNNGEDNAGNIQGEFKWTGIMPRFLRRVAYYGEAERMSQALGVKLPKL